MLAFAQIKEVKVQELFTLVVELVGCFCINY